MDYNLDRFIKAQEKDYDKAYREIKMGKKETHWMWYIFPQLKDLGFSQTAKYYGIENIEEAKSYYNNEYLRNNLISICKEILLIDDEIENIFGYPDYLKLQSCITLFELVDNNEKVFKNVLEKFFSNQRDTNTLEIINDML